MALMPKRVKHRKSQRGRIKGSATRGNKVVFGEFGLQALEAGWIKAQTIEAGRIAAQQYVRGEGKLYIGGVRLYKNGSLFSYAQSDFNTAGDDSANNYSAGFVAPINLSVGDYLEIYAIVGAHTGTTQVFTGTKSSWFSVHKLIGA